MSNLIELRRTSIEFRRLSSNFLNSGYKQAKTQIIRFNKYLHENEIVRNILRKKIDGSTYDYNQFVFSSPRGDNQLNIPIDETDHINAMLCFLSELAEEETNNVLSVARSFHFIGSNKFDDIVCDFLVQAFKPLVDFVVDEISKEIMLAEDQCQQRGAQINQNIQNNYGIANVAESVTSNNTVSINDIQQIVEAIAQIRTDLTAYEGSQEKTDVLDDLDVIEEQLKSENPKVSRIRKALSGIKSFFEKATSGVTTTTALFTSFTTLCQMVELFISTIT